MRKFCCCDFFFIEFEKMEFLGFLGNIFFLILNLSFTFQGQSCIDVAQDDIVPLLEELRKNNKRTKRRPASQIRISSDGNNLDSNAETPSKVIRVEVKTDDNKTNNKLGKYLPLSDIYHDNLSLSRLDIPFLLQKPKHIYI